MYVYMHNIHVCVQKLSCRRNSQEPSGMGGERQGGVAATKSGEGGLLRADGDRNLMRRRQ